MKTYKNFLNESEKYDHHYVFDVERYYTNLCEEKLLNEIDKLSPDNTSSDDPFGEEDWLVEEELDFEDLNPLIIDIINEYLKSFNSFELNFKGEVDTWKNEYSSIENIKNRIKSWAGYYILDDGDLSLINNKLVPVKQGYGNISQLGSALWILERLGNKIPCVIVKEGRYPKVLEESNSFFESVNKFNDVKKEFGVSEEDSKFDRCSIMGKLSIKILPKDENL